MTKHDYLSNEKNRCFRFRGPQESAARLQGREAIESGCTTICRRLGI